jgi:hypothetical protein
MSETFKSKAKNYSTGLTGDVKVIGTDGEKVVRESTRIQFTNWSYTTKTQGSFSAEQISAMLHNLDTYGVDFVSVASQDIKRQMGDFKVDKGLAACPVCGIESGPQTFQTNIARAQHIKKCRKEAELNEKPKHDPRVQVGSVITTKG